MPDYNYSNSRQQNSYGGNQGNRGGYDRKAEEKRATEMEAKSILDKFEKEWITNGIDTEGVDFCESVAKHLVKQKMSASYVRNIFGELKRIETKGFNECRVDFYMLRPKVAYSTARADNRGMNMQLFRDVFEKMRPNVTNDRTFKNMVNMIEAIIAFHKANHGND